MIDFKEFQVDGEQWELFARDFLLEQGFFIETSPDRGADGGKDILITEQLKGALGKYEFRWLVSCKHYAHSERSVNEVDERNILERLESFNADGFIGFYSTLASSGLNSRLTNLKSNGKIKDFKIFDHRLIENYLVRIGYSRLIMRYLPESYKRVKPLHLLTADYLPLECEVCGKDLLEALNQEEYTGVLVEVEHWKNDPDMKTYYIEYMYWACKGVCDRELEKKYRHIGEYQAITKWDDISDLVIPVLFLRWLNAFFEKARRGNYIYSEKAIEQKNYATIAIAQKAMREITEKEFERAIGLFEMGL